MASFRIGQRVRMVNPHNRKYKGITGTISRIFTERMSINYRVNCDVRWDVKLDPTTLSNTHTDRLEPIQDDGRKVVAWSECLWQPNHESAPA